MPRVNLFTAPGRDNERLSGNFSPSDRQWRLQVFGRQLIAAEVELTRARGSNGRPRAPPPGNRVRASSSMRRGASSTPRGRPRGSVLQVPIGVAPESDLRDRHYLRFATHLKQDPIVSDAKSIQPILALKLLYLEGKRSCLRPSMRLAICSCRLFGREASSRAAERRNSMAYGTWPSSRQSPSVPFTRPLLATDGTHRRVRRQATRRRGTTP